MQPKISRRHFLAGLGAGAAFTASAALPSFAFSLSALTKSPFKIAVINDEITQDFGRACEVAAKQFGMQWIELRGMWDKNIVSLDANEVAEAKRILKKYDLRVTDIASPLYKVDWPAAPKSKFSPHGDQFNAGFTYAQQEEVLERSVATARQFSTGRIRCFDFWRLEDQVPHRKAMNEVLQGGAEKVGKHGLILVLENEFECNTATGTEAAATLKGVPSKYFFLNWDPGNAAKAGENPYPYGYNLLPKERISHCHCKDTTKIGVDADWAPMGKGAIDWVGQFAALKRAGYRQAVSLETHWGGAGTPEKSSVQSWAGMKEVLRKAGAL
jgi:sugar phosphate isomerase/epimerase